MITVFFYLYHKKKYMQNFTGTQNANRLSAVMFVRTKRDKKMILDDKEMDREPRRDRDRVQGHRRRTRKDRKNYCLGKPRAGGNDNFDNNLPSCHRHSKEQAYRSQW